MWLKLLVGIAVTTMFAIPGQLAQATCNTSQLSTGNCTANGTSISIATTSQSGGSSATPGSQTGSGSAGAIGGNSASSGTTDPTTPRLKCFLNGCRTDAPPAAGGAPATDPITVSDLASFSPAPGEIIVQPDGWGIEGQATNVYVSSSEHTEDGELFDEPITVRWTPVAATFNYGDGTTSTSNDTGTQWAAGEELTETTTSHVYEEVGNYTITATVEFSAEINMNGQWFPVPGTITVTPEAQTVQIYRVDTVLVRGDCIQYPEDPGCPGWQPPANP